MDDVLLQGLNPNQRAAVTSSAPVLQVLAPPGSGKTKTLTTRVAYLIAHEQLKPWNIITCTFTRKAANEMKERIRNFVGDELAKQIKLGTFHAITVQYLRQYGQHIGLEKDFGIADSSDSKAILKRIIKKNKFSIEPGSALGRISAKKCKGVDSAEVASKAKHVEQQEFAQIFAAYEAELQESNLLDYDDLLLRCCLLMRRHPECVSNVEAVLIDEFQDTNNIQYDLMGLFAQKCNVITIVGDPDQSIYGFRNAEIQNLARMKQQWPDTLTINLRENYRSSGAILYAAQNIIEQDESRPPKRLQATHSPGLRPVLRKLPSAAGEATWLVSEIKRMCALSGNVLNPSDFAVLLRTASLSRVIEAALGKQGVPYRMVGGVKFFERAEVKLVLDYLRVINQPSNSEAVERIVNVPSRKVGEATVKSLREEASSKDIGLWDLIHDICRGRYKAATKIAPAAEKGLSAFANVIISGRKKMASTDSEQVSVVDLMNLVIKKIDLEGYLKHKYENEAEARWSNIEELIALAADASDPERLRAMVQEQSLPAIDGLEQRADAEEDALFIFLANVALTASAEAKAAEGTEPVQQVTISTIHSAKGLEWPMVFIPACYEGSIPHSRSDDNDEERRLLYVGMTRAQAMLYLSCPIKNTQREDTTMSSYLSKPGVTPFFEEHGPSISLASANGLATTLRREQPTTEAFEEGKKSLERVEDNYWPLNGEEPAEERAKWDYGKAESSLPVFGTTRPASWVTSGSVTMNQEDTTMSTDMKTTGFVSVKDKYDELVEKNKLSAIDKRAKSQKNGSVEAPKGRKRQIDGQGTIAGFFAKRRQPFPPDEDNALSTEASTKARVIQHSQKAPLREVSNFNDQSSKHSGYSRPVVSTTHKIRTAPLRPRSTMQPSEPAGGDLFLSSPSPTGALDENQPSDTVPTSASEECVQTLSYPTKPATTLHTTSVQSLQSAAPRVKRLGAKPGFNGWANRGRR